MDAVTRRKIEMAGRVRAFFQTYPPEAGDVAALTRFEELVKRAERLAGQERAGRVAARAATEQRSEVRRFIQQKLLRYLAAVGTAAARDRAELRAEFRLSAKNTSHQEFLTVAKAMHDKAAAQKDLLVERGMAPTLLDDLGRALADFEKSLEQGSKGRQGHTGARSDLRALAKELRDHVRVLDGLVRYRFGNNSEVMGAWASARNLAGPFKPKAGEDEEPEASGDAAAAA